jgi:nucleoside phosphorylase
MPRGRPGLTGILLIDYTSNIRTSILSSMDDKTSRTVMEIPCHMGRFLDRKIVTVFRRAKYKVNVAVLTTLMIEHFSLNEIILVGQANAINPNLDLGDILVGSSVIQPDLGRYSSDEPYYIIPTINILKDEPGPREITCEPDTLALVRRATRGIQLSELSTLQGGAIPPAGYPGQSGIRRCVGS